VRESAFAVAIGGKADMTFALHMSAMVLSGHRVQGPDAIALAVGSFADSTFPARNPSTRPLQNKAHEHAGAKRQQSDKYPAAEGHD
jgi:hypothetical protein